MRITAVLWASEVPLFTEAARETGMEVRSYSTAVLSPQEQFQRCLQDIRSSDLILLHPTQEAYWDELIPSLPSGIPVVSFGFDLSHWAPSTVAVTVTARVNSYFVYGGRENMVRLLHYLRSEVLGLDQHAEPPLPVLWEGIYHPDADRIFSSPEEYRTWKPDRHPHTMGILFYRLYWVNRDLKVVDALIREVEREANVLAVFSSGSGDSEAGSRKPGQIVQEFFQGQIDALIDLQSSLAGSAPEHAVLVLKDLDVPVFHPLTLYYRSREEWLSRPDGLSGNEIGWSVVVPELQGMVEMLALGTAMGPDTSGGSEWHEPLEERISRIVARVMAWIRLRRKPNHEKRIAFLLNNAPCASVEANVGAAAHLDALESVVEILRRMQDKGYAVECPSSGEELIQTIMERRAISEFRWTSVEDSVRGGGYLGMVEAVRYREWFMQLDPAYQERVVQAWGEPPGEEREGVPAAMVYQGKIVITGISLGNAVVCTQPKRGCAGSRCDGTVCRILHDPEVPPPHHYLATYRYLQEEFGADAIVHVGTHGTLEFLPGKSIALSPRCAPDAVLGNLPHLYLYNSDNPPEGTIAKRRAYATLIDHLQTVMEGGSLYGDLKELEDRIAEYRKVIASDRARAHALEHIILDLIRKSGIASDVQLDRRLEGKEQLDQILEEVHQVLARFYGTQLPQGMHVFGRIPTRKKQALFITSILRYHGTVRSLMGHLMGLDMPVSSAELALLRVLDEASLAWVKEILQGMEPMAAAERVLGDRLLVRDEQGCARMGEEVKSIAYLLSSSDELGSLLHALEGGYVEPGPSGLITRGKVEILPTGRNFYSLDPSSVPTEAAWIVGKRLAQALLEKFRSDQNETYPENVGMLWMASDIMWADGEQFAQMLYLLGVEPVWNGGRVQSFRVIPLSLLGRPRIDVTVRASAILRDCFASCIELLDDAIRAVAELEESQEVNFVRKHAQEQGETVRIFSSRPGTYGMGVNLAVYASAWKDVTDLSQIFVTWNGYGYGRNRQGEPAQKAFLAQLKTVQVTFNKTVTDEYDLLGCCCYFGSHGGMTAAARTVSGKPVAPYYGDTRNAERVDVRTLGEEMTRVVRSKLLHPRWIEGLKEHGYSGASEIARRIGRLYGWEATTEEVDDCLFDDIARTFLLDPEMRRFFEEHNPWALEEAGRRLLEAHARGLWEADPEVLEGVREAYLEIEGWMEESLHGDHGTLQGGAIDIIPLPNSAGLERPQER